MKDIVWNTVLFTLCIQIVVATNEKYDCLILTPYIKNGSAETARSLSKIDDQEFHGVKSHSGYLTVKEEYNSNLFFWFFPTEPLATTPWIIWLHGGPGVTSLKGLFDLIGPLKFENGQVNLRNVTWASDYSVLFLDNPVGSGFSFTEFDEGYPNNEDDIGDQMFEFVTQFLHIFPELREAPLFITGESYAGKYIPALGIQIHKRRNENNSINLKGLAIGNGLIDPRSMMHYSELCSVLGFLDDDGIAKVKTMEETVVQLIDENKIVDASNKFNETIEYIKSQSKVSIYNFNDDPKSIVTEFVTFVTRPEIRKIIHVGTVPFNYNNQLVYEKMLPDIMNTTKPFVEELLEHYAVMSYSGQQDIILGYSLSKYTFAELKWSRKNEYEQAKRTYVHRYGKENGDVVAYVKAGGNFWDVLIRRAGHMVPAEQPEAMKLIIDSFIQENR